jgi:hypothetical protein
MVKNGTLASPATARAISVLPVPLEFAGVAQKLDDLLQVLLRLVDAGDVLEGHAAMRLGQELRPRLAEAERLAARPLHLAGEEDPHPDQGDEGKPGDEQRHEPGHVVLRRSRRDGDLLAVEALHQAGVVGRIGVEAAAVGVGAMDFLALDDDVADLAGINVIEQLRERDVLRNRALPRVLEYREKRQQQQDDNHPEGEIAQIGIHPATLKGSSVPGRTGFPAAAAIPTGSNVSVRLAAAKQAGSISLNIAPHW